MVDFTSYSSQTDMIEGVIKSSTSIWSEIYSRMGPTDTLWVFVSNMVDNGSFWSMPMALCQLIQSEAEYSLRDIITIHRNTGFEHLFRGSYEEILLLVKDKDRYHFDKDKIRMEPVYEGKEWNGLRENSHSSYRDRITKRYNSDGKDPGNVWLNEIRTETESSVLDRTEPISRAEAIQRCIRAGSKEGETISTVWASDELIEVIEAEGRIAEQLSDVEQ